MAHDLRLALRVLLKDRGFTLIAVLILALGIGANTTIFSVVHSALIEALPYQDPDRLDFIWEDATSYGFPKNTPSPATYFEWRERSRSFSDMAAVFGRSVNLTGSGEPERLDAYRVTGSFFSILGVRPVVGRLIAPEDDHAGSQVTVISYSLWQRRFGGDRNLVGRTISVDGTGHTVLGVLPRSFRFPGDAADVFLPAAWTPEQRASRGHFIEVFGRRKADVPERFANDEMVAIGKQLEREGPEEHAKLGAFTTPFREQLSGNTRPALLVLLGTVGLLLLIACSNVASLLLARAAKRRREMAVRVALGAGRLRLLRQLLAESVVLSVGGGLAGILLAIWTNGAIRPMLPVSLFLAGDAAIEGRLILFALGASLLTGLIFGLAPAAAAWRTDVNDALKEGTRGSSAGQGARAWLVAAEAALSLVLLIGAGLILKSFATLTGVDPGFNPDHVLTMRVSLPMPKYSQDTKRIAFYDEMLRGVRALPGVQFAGGISRLPLSSRGGANGIVFEGQPTPPPGQMRVVNVRDTTPGYMETMRARLLRGRLLNEQDRSDSLKVAVVNDAMARRCWPGEEAVGKRFQSGTDGRPAPWISVVGIVADMRQQSLAEPAVPEIYFPVTQSNRPALQDLVIRTRVDPLSIANAVRHEIWKLDADLPVAAVRPLEDVISLDVASQRLQAVLLGSFAALALILAAVGIYGVVSYAVAQRTRELGIRLAIGAGTGSIVSLVLRQGLRPVLGGLAIGLVAALGSSRLLASLLYGVQPTDPAVFVTAPLVLVAAALVASIVPARRAARVDPVVALRAE